MFWNLRNKLLMPILGMVLLGSSCISLFSYLAARNALEVSQVSDALSSVQGLHDITGFLLSSATMELQNIAERTDTVDLLSTANPKSRMLLEKHMKTVLDIQFFYRSMTLLNREGVIVASSSGTVGQNRQDRDYFKTAMKGTFAISAPSISKSTGDSIIIFATPSIDKKGEILGVATTVLDLAMFSAKYVAPVRLGYKGFAMITDSEGVIVAHKDPKEIAKTMPDVLLKKLHSLPQGAESFVVTLNGELTHCYVKREENSGWFAIILVDDDDFYRNVQIIAEVNILLAFFCIIFTAIVVYIVVRSVTHALSGAVYFASAVAAGDLEQKLCTNRTDEIGILDNALVTMVAKLKEMISSAQAATVAKSDFLARMSHEIRTPMNAILGMAHIALRAAPAPQQKNYLLKIQTAAQGLLGIINDILDYSKIEAGKMSLESVEFSLSGILQSVYELFEEQASKKQIVFTRQIANGVHDELIGDSLRLAQICTNLCSNAFKFTETGHIELNVAIQEEQENRVLLHFSIKDSGIGMTKQQLAIVFESFTQADGSTTRRFGGTGLGLTICKLLVELMGGTIWAESTPSVGSVFHFNVWLEKNTATQVDVQFNDLPSKDSENFANARVLLAEDNFVNQEIAISFLQEFGIIPVVANNGMEALALCQEQAFDLVLMDIQMPIMGGLEATRRIRRCNVYNTATMPIIAMTANAMSGDREKSLLAGMNEHITKPLIYAEFRRALNRFLAG